MSDHKLFLHDTAVCLEEFDIVTLLETHLDPKSDLHFVARLYTFWYDCSWPSGACLRGYGISVFVRDTLATGIFI